MTDNVYMWVIVGFLICSLGTLFILIIVSGGHMKQEKYYIWSVEHHAWWKANKRGYTTEINHAGMYDKKEAEEICHDANMFGINEKMVRV